MRTVTTDYRNAITKGVRQFKAKATFYNADGTVYQTFNEGDKLISFEITRTGEQDKFFGFGISNKCNIKLIDKSREYNFSTSNYVVLEIGVRLANGGYFYIPYPQMTITEVNRDETSNQLSITAYDKLRWMGDTPIANITTTIPYTMRSMATAIATYAGLTASIPASLTAFDLSYVEGANIEGTESLTKILTGIAEATQTIFFIDCNGKLVFKRLGTTADLDITKNDYISLDTKTNRRLSRIVNTTELGDATEASIPTSGSTQFVRNNPFWELRTDLAELLDAAIQAVGGFTMGQYDCVFRGNPALEPGDCISFTTKDDDKVIGYLINDSISFNGSLSQKLSWEYADADEETAENPISLGEALNKTYARVDKANKEIAIVASKADENEANIAALNVTTQSISATVTGVQTHIDDAIDGVNEDIAELNRTVTAKMNEEQVQLMIENTMSNGVSSITTTTGFTFNEDGLTIDKTGSEMKTTINENGMIIERNANQVLVANNEGVDAYNLHASTYLIIGDNSRFEDYNNNSRTGCFWIGG